MLMVADGRGRGIKNLLKSADVINGRPHRFPQIFSFFLILLFVSLLITVFPVKLVELSFRT